MGGRDSEAIEHSRMKLSAGSLSRPGPEVNGRATAVHLLDHATLRASEHLGGYMNVVNAAFSHRHPPYIPAEFVRVITPQQILKEVGPDSSTFLITQKIENEQGQGRDVVIATGSVLPAPNYSSTETTSDENETKTTVERSLKARKPLVGVIDWELKHVCVEPGSMSQGLAGYLLKLLDQEILGRVQQSMAEERDSSRVGDGRNQIRVMITTIKELNGPWYERKGYRTVESSHYEAGTLGGTEPFDIWHMDRMLE